VNRWTANPKETTSDTDFTSRHGVGARARRGLRGAYRASRQQPGIGIRGNTHFPMSDLNNVQIADLLSKFLSDKRLN